MSKTDFCRCYCNQFLSAGVRVMVGSSIVGFKSGSWRLMRILTLSCCVLGCTSNLASAQLRSGRTTRTLYQDQLREPISRRPGKVDSQAEVVTASYASGSQSILDVADEYPDVVSASCSDCGPEMQADLGCGATGCDSMGCDTCCGGYSAVAPTCTQVCPPGCGPLMALWCRLQVRAEVPLYWRRNQGPPALVTTADVGTGADVAGQLGETTTRTLFGGPLSDESQAGVRLTFRTWLGSGERYGLVLRYWNAGDQNESSSFDSNGFPILARPFLNTTGNGAPAQDTQLISFPGDSVGDIRVETSSSVEGLDLLLRRQLYQDRFTRVDWLYGYQHVSIDEGLSIASNTTVTGTIPGLQGTSIAVSDRFQTENDFHGMSHGIMSTRSFACWKMETMFRLGFGNLRRKVNAMGSTTTTSGGASNTDNQGLLARFTNSQPLTDDTFVIVPEVGINFAYRIRPGFDVNVGYNYMMIPKVAQAAQQIDDNLAVNLSDPLLGALDPSLDFGERSYWLHSLGLGAQLRY